MYQPKYNYAYEKLQEDLEGFIEGQGFEYGREHEVVDWFGEQDIFRYDIIVNGEERGSIYYCWGGERNPFSEGKNIIETDGLDKHIRPEFEFEFRDEEKRLERYAQEYTREVMVA